MLEQSLPRPTTRTPVNSILGGKVKGGEGEREGGRGIRGRRESYHVEEQSAPPGLSGCRASDPSLSSGISPPGSGGWG